MYKRIRASLFPMYIKGERRMRKEQEGGGGSVYSPRKYLHLYAIIFPACPVHGIMLSGETRLSRILKGFNNIWKLLPKSWRSSSSLRYVLGATLGIRPIHLLFSSASSPFPSSLPPLLLLHPAYYESLGSLRARGGKGKRTISSSSPLPPPPLSGFILSCS